MMSRFFNESIASENNFFDCPPAVKTAIFMAADYLSQGSPHFNQLAFYLSGRRPGSSPAPAGVSQSLEPARPFATVCYPDLFNYDLVWLAGLAPGFSSLVKAKLNIA
jgi:hypothetical protein